MTTSMGIGISCRVRHVSIENWRQSDEIRVFVLEKRNLEPLRIEVLSPDLVEVVF